MTAAIRSIFRGSQVALASTYVLRNALILAGAVHLVILLEEKYMYIGWTAVRAQAGAEFSLALEVES